MIQSIKNSKKRASEKKRRQNIIKKTKKEIERSRARLTQIFVQDFYFLNWEKWRKMKVLIEKKEKINRKKKKREGEKKTI